MQLQVRIRTMLQVLLRVWVNRHQDRIRIMTVLDSKNRTKNVVTEGVAMKVTTVTKTWVSYLPPADVARPAFDPRAAGRRAVAKHSDALRRLSS